MERNYCTSDMTGVFTMKSDPPITKLRMGEVTSLTRHANFNDLRQHVLTTLRYPMPHSSKAECYGWTPTQFRQSIKDIATRNGLWRKPGMWRVGDQEIDSACVWVGDVDNDWRTGPTATMEKVASRLNDLGVTYFLYSSFSSKPDKPKFRVVIDISREITRAEMRLIYLWMRPIMGRQGDQSIYDPSDFLFAPPHRTEIVFGDGVPLGVDGAIAEATAGLTRADRDWLEASAVDHTSAGPITPEQRAAIDARLASWEYRPGATITNPDLFRAEWRFDYGRAGSHWESMRSILGKVWAKSGGSLTRGEMDEMFAEIDNLDGGYFRRKYGAVRQAELINFIMRQYVPASTKPMAAADPLAEHTAKLRARSAAKAL